MPSERLSWVAELFDKMSMPSRRIAQRLGEVNAVMRPTKNAFGDLGQAQDRAGEGGLKLKSVLGGVVGGMIAYGYAFAHTAIAIGEAAFEQFAFKEGALATGKALWGSAEAAEAMFKRATALAKVTPFNVGEVVGAFNKLGAAGFAAEEVPVVFQGLADIASMSGRGAEAIGSLTLAFSQMMGKGHLAGQELNQVTEAAGGAVSRMKMFAQIAKLMNVDEKSIDSMVQNGLVPARTAIMAIMQVSKDLGGGIIGQNSIEQSKTLGGLWSNLQDTLTNLWLTMDLSKAPWFGAVKKFLASVIDALDTGSAAGKHLQDVMGRLFGQTIGGFLGDGTKDLSGFVMSMTDAFETVASHSIAAFKGLWDGLKTGFGPLLQGLGAMDDNQDSLERTRVLFEGIGVAVADFVTGIATIAWAVNQLVRPFRWLGESLQALWDSLVKITSGVFTLDGSMLLGGLKQLVGWDSMFGVGATAGDGLNKGFAAAIDAHSPSRVFEGFGENVVQGFNRGVDTMPGMDSTLAQDLAAGAAGRGGSSAGGVSIALTVNVNANGAGDADSIAQAVADRTASTLTGLFEQMALEAGVA